MSVDNIVFSCAVLTLFFASCANDRIYIDLGPAISSVSGCFENDSRCPDSIFVSTQNISLQDFDLTLWHHCLQQEKSIGDVDLYGNEKVLSHIPSVVYDKKLYSYDHKKDWIPPHQPSQDRLFVSYSEIFSSKKEAIVYVVSYLSGREISVSACVFNRHGSVFEFDDCYCRMNPF